MTKMKGAWSARILGQVKVEGREGGEEEEEEEV